MGNVQSTGDKSSTSFPKSVTSDAHLDNDIARNTSVDAGSGLYDDVGSLNDEVRLPFHPVSFGLYQSSLSQERPNVKKNITLSEFEVSSESESGSDRESVLSDSTSSYQDCGVAFGKTSDDESEYCPVCNISLVWFQLTLGFTVVSVLPRFLYYRTRGSLPDARRIFGCSSYSWV